MRLIVLQAGDVVAALVPTRGEYLDLIRETVGDAWGEDWGVVDVRSDAPVPDPSTVAGYIMTGSSASVTERAPWMLRTEARLREIAAANIPLFGICFGHQMIAQALGGEVTKNPRGREVGSVFLDRLAIDPIMSGLPERFSVNTTHVDTVARLPAGARLLASTTLEPTAAFAIGDTVRGVQFHPELDASAMRAYVVARSEGIQADGMDPEKISAAVIESPENGAVLKNFVIHVVKKRRA
ncbi:MAG: glutamine amidotransferase [Polyangiaceae bacterium]